MGVLRVHLQRDLQGSASYIIGGEKMQVELCQNRSENNIINKNVSLIDTASCTIKGPISVENPVLILDYDSDLQDINYIRIAEFSRCYYITDIVNLTGHRYQITCKTDVLESFKDNILGLSVIIEKGSNAGNVNMFLDDGSYICENKEFNTVLNFPSGFNEAGEYILITAGGGGGII